MKFQQLIEIQTNILAQIYETVEEAGVVSEDIEELEQYWIGGVGDLGNAEAGQAIQNLPEYPNYAKILQDAVKHYLGNEFFIYRLAQTDWVEAAQHGDHNVGPISVTLSPKVAGSFRKFAGMGDAKSRVLIQSIGRPGGVIMRGHLSEQELVYDSFEIQPTEIRILDSSQHH